MNNQEVFLGLKPSFHNQTNSTKVRHIGFGKRFFDIILATVGIILGAPIMLLIALAVKLESPGEIIFSQPRLGKDGKPFNILKFRKFPSNWGNKGPGVTVAGDVRMTRVGNILERTKLDELPQLWNILIGEMSFVGPRPESLRYKHLFDGEYSGVLRFVPGIFGPNQVEFRNESAMYPLDIDPEVFYTESLFPRKAKKDYAFFSNSNFFSELGWIVKGLYVSFIGAINWKQICKEHLPLIVIDGFFISLSWTLAILMRYGKHDFILQYEYLITGMWMFPLILLPLLIIGGVYRRTLRHISPSDVIRTVLLLALGWGTAFLALLYFLGRDISFMLAPLGFLLSSTFMITPRVIYKEFIRFSALKQSKKNTETCKHILIYGVDDRAVKLGSLIQVGFPDAELVGFIEDEITKQGKPLLGVRILGSERDLSIIQQRYHFDQLWFVQIPDPNKLSSVKKWCEENNVLLVLLPALGAFSTLHDEKLEDKFEGSVNFGYS
jgi:lipopolysaccharide/colanic/teichoic acid biosynthesis glycosyltransferase